MAVIVEVLEDRTARIRRLAQRLALNPNDMDALRALAALDQSRQYGDGEGRGEAQPREVDLEYRLKTEVIAMVSHELRTPLATIKAYVELILEGLAGNLTDKQREFLLIADQGVDQLANMVTDLLDAARLEEGRVELKRRWLDLAPIIRRVASLYQSEMNARRQTLDIRVPPALPAVWADTERITQVLSNLVSNAIKYTPDGGKLVITAMPEAESLTIQVSDTGVGLSAEDQRHIFTSFYRARQPENAQIPGVGLGLTISRTLIELHGGQISVESTLGKGSTFTVRLPRTVIAQPVKQSA